MHTLTLPTSTTMLAWVCTRYGGTDVLRLRTLPRPVIGHIANAALWLDLRCLETPDVPAFTAQLPALADALAQG